LLDRSGGYNGVARSVVVSGTKKKYKKKKRTKKKSPDQAELKIYKKESCAQNVPGEKGLPRAGSQYNSSKPKCPSRSADRGGGGKQQPGWNPPRQVHSRGSCKSPDKKKPLHSPTKNARPHVGGTNLLTDQGLREETRQR